MIRLYSHDPRISTFHTSGIGLPAVCNLALEQARGKYIIRLDADDIFDENILLVLKNCLDRDADCALAFPDYYLITPEGDIFAHEWREKIYHRDHVLDIPANGACSLIRTEILRRIGGYREDLKAQDGLDLWTKLQKEYVIKNVNLPLFYYRRHNTNLTNKSSVISNARRNIKLQRIQERGLDDTHVTFFIPCRRFYDFAEDLWNVRLNDKTLLEINIERCLAVEMADSFIVASDNEETQQVLSRYKDERLHFFLRDREDTIRTRVLWT